MSIFLSLIKTSLNMNFGISALKYRFTKEKTKIFGSVLIGLSVVVGFGSIIALFRFLLYSMYTAGKSINHPELVLVLAFMAGQLLVLFFGIFYIMSTFYFSRDFDVLVPLPIKPSYVVGSKFITVMVNEYITLIPFVLPAIIIYGVGTGQHLFYWLKALLLLLLAPVIPLAAASLLILIIMRFVNLRKSKDLLAIIGGIVILFISLGINYFAQSVQNYNQMDLLKNIGNYLVNIVGSKFPPSLWATFGLARSGLEGAGYFLLFTGVSLVLFIFVLWLANLVFYKGLLSGQEITRKRRTISENTAAFKQIKASGQVQAIFMREWKIFLRTPVFAFNGLAGIIIVPLLIIMPNLANNKAMTDLFRFINQGGNASILTFAGLGILFVTSGLNIVASTSVSREGMTFWVSKMIPVSVRDQINAKIIHGMTVQTMGIVITGIILEIIVKYSAARLLVIIFLTLLLDLVMIIQNLIIDVYHPKLYWNNPQEAVKQNINGVIGMALTLLIGALFGGLTYLLFNYGANEWLIYALIAVIAAALLIPSAKGLYKLAEYKYRQIEM